MIYFDKSTLKVLKYIRRKGSKGAVWSDIAKIYGEDAASSWLLDNLTLEHYTVTKSDNGEWYDCLKLPRSTNCKFRSYITPKGNELLETRSFNLYKWLVPTTISILALVLNIVTLLCK